MGLAVEIPCAGIKPKLTAIEVEDPNNAGTWELVEQATSVPTNTYGSRSTTNESCLYSNNDASFTSGIEPGTATVDMNWQPDSSAPGQAILRAAFLINDQINVRYRYSNTPETVETFAANVTNVSRPITDDTFIAQSIDLQKSGQPTYVNP